MVKTPRRSDFSTIIVDSYTILTTQIHRLPMIELCPEPKSALKRKALDSCGKEEKRDPAGTRRLDLLPAESKRLQRKGTVTCTSACWPIRIMPVRFRRC